MKNKVENLIIKYEKELRFYTNEISQYRKYGRVAPDSIKARKKQVFSFVKDLKILNEESVALEFCNCSKPIPLESILDGKQKCYKCTKPIAKSGQIES